MLLSRHEETGIRSCKRKLQTEAANGSAPLQAVWASAIDGTSNDYITIEAHTSFPFDANDLAIHKAVVPAFRAQAAGFLSRRIARMSQELPRLTDLRPVGGPGGYERRIKGEGGGGRGKGYGGV